MSKHPPDHEHIDENMIKVEVNLDDTPGEWLGYVMDKLFDAGANDVYYTSIYMKKNRPAVQLQLLCSENRFAEMKDILLAETTTLGIRYYPISVYRMERQIRQVDTKWGPVTVKEGLQGKQVVKAAPEYEDCKALAEQHHVPLKDVYHEVWKKLK
ncbi:LarC family nickel insertion protein [Gracilibacillus caseinilyticus]|uniref:LarC family nickel insertion protein n=1 Tax=Gracilibacillus caseinilyticus TaxID=2932256 RepID=A0ABY4F1U3_9BACI|nr:nickel insertion protein [Gracilibacillus caseinilyticus]UOQ50043.1 LarC family nickel insertion protein [Gracilibacillus caseinilyticus]